MIPKSWHTAWRGLTSSTSAADHPCHPALQQRFQIPISFVFRSSVAAEAAAPKIKGMSIESSRYGLLLMSQSKKETISDANQLRFQENFWIDSEN
ncbi:hypothetical protein DVH24_016794 [Malus domestica]|uniref:Uncharacterized protein n=1 Tax=Malus domestica TaxID=3750 RepID=A0A498HVE8_MALDO|nr:hypothetical protein DVH24_016794 [Malus domestica]